MIIPQRTQLLQEVFSRGTAFLDCDRIGRDPVAEIDRDTCESPDWEGNDNPDRKRNKNADKETNKGEWNAAISSSHLPFAIR